MKRTVLIFGLISGVISSAMMCMTLPLLNNGTISFDNSMVIGYTSILLSFLLVFFGIRSYRDNVAGGSITFGRAFAVGILIALISSAFYVASWEVLYYNFIPDFMDKCTTQTVENLRRKGASAEEVVAKQKEMDDLKVTLANPAMNAALTFLEPFPVGVLVTLISSAILRKRATAAPPVNATALA